MHIIVYQSCYNTNHVGLSKQPQNFHGTQDILQDGRAKILNQDG